MKALALTASLLLLAGCGQKKPVLTLEAFVAAAKKCGAEDATFSERDDGRLPTIQFTNGVVDGAQGTVRISDCLAAEFKQYRFEAMEIRVQTTSSKAS